MTSAEVGALACQRDSYRQSIDSTVVEVSAAKDSGNFHVVLSDTVLFPTGGGQPNDLGTLVLKDVSNPQQTIAVQVLDVQRIGLKCVHVVPRSLEVGQTVVVVLDWKRRWDHMQQHSGQHLLSAIAETEFNWDTVGWMLGKERNYVDLSPTANHPAPSAQLDMGILLQIEERVNQVIRQNLSVIVHEDDHDETKAKPESMPNDIDRGVVRWVEIGKLDRNPCCGTHVKSTAELQVLKILSLERIRGGKHQRVNFVFGDRVVAALQASLERDRALGPLLNTGPESFVETVTRQSQQLRIVLKRTKDQTKEIAELLAFKLTLELNSSAEPAQVLVHHREDGDADFASAMVKVVVERCPQIYCVVTVGSPKEGGMVVIQGPNAVGVDQIVKCFANACGDSVKGGGRNDKWQGKAVNWKGLAAAQAAIQVLHL
ncbi:Threonyl/alanyl tRNA synthetase [Polychytrium aggregatum]|uniref:Threonyl/alanyl tRNA synthetase n=1 Tax=Polychytrium aggregatum TaxID=110093 RepID=UPI0022FEA8BD|nr:Threonyl/alanyl tRNA synthetase [Polychytrium aggregatum]KAI9207092.1 Threonyl/alanyl tRNA synthetase [Polychytrium aggregatum]